MKLNGEGKVARFYLWFEMGDLPDNLCRLFWGLVGRIGLSLFVASFVSAIVISVGYWGWQLLKFGGSHPWVSVVVAGLAVTAVILWRRSKRGEFAAGVVGTVVDSIKNRYCPRIEWD